MGPYFDDASRSDGREKTRPAECRRRKGDSTQSRPLEAASHRPRAAPSDGTPCPSGLLFTGKDSRSPNNGKNFKNLFICAAVPVSRGAVRDRRESEQRPLCTVFLYRYSYPPPPSSSSSSAEQKPSRV